MMMIHKSVAPLATAILLVAGTSVLVANPGHAQAAHSTAKPAVAPTQAGAQQGQLPGERRYFVGSSVFVAANLLPNDEPPAFFQINIGYRVTPKDVVSLEAITWQYHAPLGVPWGSSKGAAEERYPGSVREIGVGVAYQRFVWNNLDTSAHALPLLQRYQDEDGRRIQNGFQLFTTGRVGYQLSILGGRAFLEPSMAATAWPINTNVPESFAAKEQKWPCYFLIEPGLHSAGGFSMATFDHWRGRFGVYA